MARLFGRMNAVYLRPEMGGEHDSYSECAC